MQGQTNQSILKPRLQRRLRRMMTDAERTLWQRLRMRQVENCKFRRQHPLGDYIVDFVCLERRVVVELDGGQHADQVAKDTQRTERMEKAGYRVLRFWNHHVFQELDSVVESILGALSARARENEDARNPSPPNPPLEGEG